MKRIFNKIIVFVCVALTCCSALFAVACKNDDSQNGSQKRVYQGTHIYTAPDTEDYFVKDGKTDYVIVLPETLTPDLKTAKEEFIHLLKMATGTTIYAIPDTGLVFDENARYISIGNTSVYQTSGLNLELGNLKNYGARIVTEGKSVFLLSETDKGVLNSVYTFMQVTFNYDYYYRDVVEIDNVTEMKLKDYDVTDIPDIQDRVVYSNMLDDEFSDYDMNMYRERLKNIDDIGYTFMPVWTGEPGKSGQKSFHNTLCYLPRDQYDEYSGYFYSDRGEQLCYTAHGDPEMRQLMVELCAQKVIDCLIYYDPINYPYKNVMTISMEDNGAICDCAACTANKDYYGADSANVILFVNDMCEIVEDWMAQPENSAYYRDDFNIMFFAYHNYEACPATEINGKYVLNNGLTMHPMSSAWVALAFSYVANFYDSVNDTTREKMQSWFDVCDNIRLWVYSYNFTFGEAFYDLFNFFTTDFYQYVSSYGASYILNEGNGAGISSNFQTLAVYLNAKLCWDSSLNSAELTDKWFNAMYKDAAPIMRKVFNDIRIYMLSVVRGDGGDAEGSIMGGNYGFKSYWPEGLLKSWMATMDQAILAVDKYKEIDAKTYEKIVNHIGIEYVAPATHLIRFHGSLIETSEYQSVVERLTKIQEYMKNPSLATLLKGF